MQSEERDPALLLDILSACEKIEAYVGKKSKEGFLADSQLQDAVERNLEIIGEAVTRLSDQVRGENPDVPWRQVVALRNILIHQYGEVDAEEIWNVVTVHVPGLRDVVKPLLPSLE